jgi:hypothetical protein
MGNITLHGKYIFEELKRVDMPYVDILIFSIAAKRTEQKITSDLCNS